MKKDIFTGKNDQYLVYKHLGQGGFGTTWLAARTSDKKQVVVKQLRVERMSDWKSLELFEREAKVLASLKHENIPKYMDYFELGSSDSPEGFVIVQAFVPGRTLRQSMKDGERLEGELMASWFTKMLEICDYLHRLNPPVIHRDINPQNIILRETDKEPVLIDFGTVQAVLSSIDTVSSTSAGTFGYAALEQFVGRATPASDLYGLAMTWLSVATGMDPDQMPFASNRVHVRETLENISVDARLILVLEEMTEPDAARRPQSAREVLDRLQSLSSISKQKDNDRKERSIASIVPLKDSKSPVISNVKTGGDELKIQSGSPAEQEILRYRELAKLSHKFKVGEMETYSAPDMEYFRHCAISDDGSFVLLGDPLCSLSTTDLKASFFGSKDKFGIQQMLICADASAVVVGNFSDNILHHQLPSGQWHKCELKSEGTGSWLIRGGFGTAIALRPDRKIFAVLNERKIRLFDAVSGDFKQAVKVSGIDTTFINPKQMHFSPDGTAIIVCMGYKGTYLIGADGKVYHKEFHRIRIAPDGRMAAVVKENKVLVGELMSLVPFEWRSKAKRVLEAKGEIEQLRFSPDGSLLAAASRSNELIIVNTETKRRVANVTQPHLPDQLFAGIETFGFTADKDRLFIHGKCVTDPLSSNAKEVLTVYSVSQEKPIGTIGASKKGTMAVSCSGLHSRLDKKKGRRIQLTRDLFLGKPMENLLRDKELDKVRELEGRIRFWTTQVSKERIHPGDDTVQTVNESKGLVHLLPAIIERASASADSSGRFGDADISKAIPVNRVLDELKDMSKRSVDEQALLFEEMLPGVAREFEANTRKEVNKQRTLEFKNHLKTISLIFMVVGFPLFVIGMIVQMPMLGGGGILAAIIGAAIKGALSGSK